MGNDIPFQVVNAVILGFSGIVLIGMGIALFGNERPGCGCLFCVCGVLMFVLLVFKATHPDWSMLQHFRG